VTDLFICMTKMQERAGVESKVVVSFLRVGAAVTGGKQFFD